MVAVTTGCASVGTQNLPPASTGAAGDSNVLIKAYLIDVGDQVRVDVWKNPELSVVAPVRPDGKIAVPLIGDVMAAGLEPRVLADNIKAGLSNYVKSPNVTVILTELQGHEFLSRIRVTGSVENNISTPYHQGMTVLDAVLEAGSVTIYANSNSTKLHRRTESGAVSYNIRLKDILEDGDMTTNILLVPGDVITVPERAF
ncbi:MAG: polysaccharide export protein [Gammaproteobacteria bacterium]|nr:polysaccharide export protein [Gammaproteobacteria bacterium]